MNGLTIPNFINVEAIEGLTGSLKNKIEYILTDSKGRKWIIYLYDGKNNFIEYKKYPAEYRQYAGTRGSIPFFKEINDRMINAIKNWELKQQLSPNTLKTFGELIDEL